MEIKYNCPNCHIEGLDDSVTSLIKCTIDNCGDILCDKCLHDHRESIHTSHQELTKEEAEQYIVNIIEEKS